MGQSRQGYGSLTVAGPMDPYYSSYGRQLAVASVEESWLKQLDQRQLHRAYATFVSAKAVNELLSSD